MSDSYFSLEEDEEEPSILTEDAPALLEWIKTQTIIPDDIDESTLAAFQNHCANDDSLKNLLLSNYIIRLFDYKLFRNRHPATFPLEYNEYLPCVTCSTDNNGQVVFIIWFSEGNAEININQIMKCLFAELDLLIKADQLHGGIVSIIMDMDNVTEASLQIVTPFAVERSIFALNSYPITFTAGILLNAHTNMHRFLRLFKIFPEVSLIQLTNTNQLAQYVPIDILPSDMGGLPGALTRDELRELTINRLKHFGPLFAYEEMVWDKILARFLTEHPNPIRKGKVSEEKVKKKAKGKKGKGKKGKGKKGKGK